MCDQITELKLDASDLGVTKGRLVGPKVAICRYYGYIEGDRNGSVTSGLKLKTKIWPQGVIFKGGGKFKSWQFLLKLHCQEGY